jgi:DNA-binding transcriptional ArsR family regulator
MSFQEVVTQELAKLLGVLSHHDRIFIIEELYKGEKEVKALQQKLGISHSRVSQHLSLLRSHKIVVERRRGRNVLYRLVNQELSVWLLDALKFIEFRLQQTDEIRSAVESARNAWFGDETEDTETDAVETESDPDDDQEKLIYVPGRGKKAEKKKPSKNKATPSEDDKNTPEG